MVHSGINYSFICGSRAISTSYNGRDIANVYYKVLTDEEHPKWSKDFVQMICRCGNIQQNPTNGYTNLVQHIKKAHPDWKAVMVEAHKQKLGCYTSILHYTTVTENARNIFHWMKWIVEDNLPFNFVEKPRTRANTKFGPISSSTLKKYLRLVSAKVECKIKNTLPESFGLVIDGWNKA
jgi:hypothetical protein